MLGPLSPLAAPKASGLQTLAIPTVSLASVDCLSLTCLVLHRVLDLTGTVEFAIIEEYRLFLILADKVSGPPLLYPR